MTVIAMRDPRGLAEYIPAWEDLAAHAVELNVFYEPWMLLPAVQAFGRDRNLTFIFVFRNERKGDRAALCGFFPLEQKYGYKGLPINSLGLWKYIHCFLCTPLVRARYAAECLDAFFDWLAAAAPDHSLLELAHIGGQGPFQQLLVERCQRRGLLSLTTGGEMRALFRPGTDGDAYIQAALSTKRRKELRRLEKRMLDQGRLEYLRLQPDGNVDHWVRTFIGLEAAGWKGRANTALACNQTERDFFATIVKEAFRRGRLMMLAVHLDHRPVAQKCNLLAGTGGFAFKIAFDESYARYSPGVLLELKNIHYLHERRELQWMDSCAESNHSMIDRLWPDRRLIQHLLVATGAPGGKLVLQLISRLRWMQRAAVSILPHFLKKGNKNEFDDIKL